MEFFCDRFPEQANAETLAFAMNGDKVLPDGEYIVIDAYCTNIDCHCRDIILYVYDMHAQNSEIAVLRYEWLSDATISPGLYLEKGDSHPEYGSWLLELLTDHLHNHPEYGEMLQRHRKKFRASIIRECFSQ